MGREGRPAGAFQPRHRAGNKVLSHRAQDPLLGPKPALCLVVHSGLHKSAGPIRETHDETMRCRRPRVRGPPRDRLLAEGGFHEITEFQSWATIVVHVASQSPRQGYHQHTVRVGALACSSTAGEEGRSEAVRRDPLAC